ncbi:tropomyosin-like [Manihot esculenta]|uniref:tropomyosin-like n=1 Tax=Manihot esculenta TaxID=3983 RepID=UPI000B5D24DA|nr:tropomyosin-like [Manihot esculenta]
MGLTGHIEEARLEENLSATSDARGNLAAIREDYRSLQVDLHMALEARKKAEGETVEGQNHAQSLEAELSHARRVLKESDERAAAVEVRCEEVLKQLSSTVDALRERDEAVSQKEEVQHRNEQLKADFDATLAQRNEALARVVVLEQELSKQTDNVKGLTLAVEESQLQNQQLCQQVESLEKKCSALLKEAKLAEDRSSWSARSA